MQAETWVKLCTGLFGKAPYQETVRKGSCELVLELDSLNTLVAVLSKKGAVTRVSVYQSLKHPLPDTWGPRTPRQTLSRFATRRCHGRKQHNVVSWQHGQQIVVMHRGKVASGTKRVLCLAIVDGDKVAEKALEDWTEEHS